MHGSAITYAIDSTPSGHKVFASASRKIIIVCPSVTPETRTDRTDVLAQPTRARLFARVASFGRPVRTDELAREVGLHPSGVRVHLERMRAAGLIDRERVAQPRGRPRDVWSVAADALPAGEPPDAYVWLSRWLARTIPARPGRLREVHRVGRELGRELCARDRAGAPEEAMGRALTALGFAPQRERRDGTRVVFKLGNCPYRAAVAENQPVICELHRGLTQGLLDELDPSAQLTRFVPEDPDRAGCLIEVAGLDSI
jgi:predicted ArsR family transcriptional regulator